MKKLFSNVKLYYFAGFAAAGIGFIYNFVMGIVNLSRANVAQGLMLLIFSVVIGALYGIPFIVFGKLIENTNRSAEANEKLLILKKAESTPEALEALTAAETPEPAPAPAPAPVEDVVFCAKCGAKNAKGMNFCASCGSKLN